MWLVVSKLGPIRGLFGPPRLGSSSGFLFKDPRVLLLEVPGAAIGDPSMEPSQADPGPVVVFGSSPASDSGSPSPPKFQEMLVARTCAVLECIGVFDKGRL